jgi:hypothetical protein
MFVLHVVFLYGLQKESRLQAWVNHDFKRVVVTVSVFFHLSKLFLNWLPNYSEEAILQAKTKNLGANTRTYNSVTSFTSVNTDLDRNATDSRGGVFAFRIHGSVHHLMSTTLIPPSQGIYETNTNGSKFAQIYIFDSENEL